MELKVKGEGNTREGRRESRGNNMEEGSGTDDDDDGRT